MKVGKRCFLAFCALVSLVAGSAAGEVKDRAAAVDSSTAITPRIQDGFGTFALPSDTISGEQFRSRHAFSLDNFLEFWPKYVIRRRGPIGADADFSRYGMGRGRGVLYLGSVPLNDPQDDRIPLALVPTTMIGDMYAGGNGRFYLPGNTNIEGSLQIAEPAPPRGKPVTAVEYARGDRFLRHGRVRFSSIVGPIGLDFEYDELQDNGYQFDARGKVEGAGYGESRTRIQSMNLRGEFLGGEEYLFSFRRFTSVFNGDLISANSELRRDGHYAVIRSSLRGLNLSVFERSHGASAPDSSTGNHTAGVYVTLPVSYDAGGEFSVGIGYEDIHSRQEMGGADSRGRLQKGYLGITGLTRLPSDLTARLDANVTHYLDLSSGWGAGITFGRRFGSSNQAVVTVKRGFRMPNLGELFQPRHRVVMNPSVELVGNRDVKAETALEASAGWVTRLGWLENEIRGTAIRIRDPIVYKRVPSDAGDLLSPQNGVIEDLFIVEDRFRFRHSFWGMGAELFGGVEYTPSARPLFFASVPKLRGNACVSIGRAIFSNTSAIRLSAEYLYSGPRRVGSVDELPAYNVVNVKFVFRLIDANIYLHWLNVSNEEYVTVWPYLMTPGTFVYGVEWTLFD